MPTITAKDETQIYYKDWGTGQPVVFSHGWPLSADDWDPQLFFFASRGFRCIAHDRRGHGRSSQPWNGNDLEILAADQRDGQTIVTVRTDGTYARNGLPDPLLMDPCFTVARDRIAALVCRFAGERPGI